MLEHALKGSKKYWLWLGFLGIFIITGAYFYLQQLKIGLGITGMSRDVSWAFYIANFTFLVGVAASAVTIVLPYYWHNHKVYGKMTILGEFLAVSAVTMCLLFVVIDMGQPMRVFNVLRYPTPNSILFYDVIVLNGYFILNLICAWTALHSYYKDSSYPSWLKPVIFLAIIWAPFIHIVTAFIYQGLPGRHYWLSAIMAPKFLVSAFSSGPALLIILAALIKKVANFDIGEKAFETLGKTMTYFYLAFLGFYLFEVFTSFYSGIPGHKAPFIYLFVGYEGHAEWVPFMWTAVILAIISLIILLNPRTRKNQTLLVLAAFTVFFSAYIEKGIGLVTGGFTPNPFETVTPYRPTLPEVLISLGVWSTGFLVLTVLYKITIEVDKRKNLAVKLKG
ncbi:menaquinol oxidoreductase [Caldimicrobium thiodismutans]|jgi:molybdopterin-containing oxidoreductase family membrane subunit|uniref:Menaquinol oxidoreductase n=1 Tax=Caldimicrobium thiodismutans TaxID=1653476 RepID=A0A0U5AG67_9BACT|nr:NrfD/PsrC family molybdoenzyme membrane anchor subunit [Caldimicrobium thiodismutans]BAU22988.1 menaquinol oxidoreductase [Caldimicrobium thiodismutans]